MARTTLHGRRLTCSPSPHPGVIAHICVVHWKLLELPNSAKIKTFYDELSIPQPHEHDMQALKISASSTIIARKKELGQHQPWSLQGPKGRGRETKSSPQDARLFVLTLIYDILTTSKLRDIYDQVFMPGLTGYWSDPRAFLQNICMWIEEEEYMGN